MYINILHAFLSVNVHMDARSKQVVKSEWESMGFNQCFEGKLSQDIQVR